MPTIKQKRALDIVVEGSGNMGEAMVKAGYSKETAKTPQKLTESKGWKELVEEHLSDKTLSKIHEGLLKSKRLDHMIFPMEVKDDIKEDPERKSKHGDVFTDDDIRDLLSDAGCKVRKIVHQELSRHVYFWSPDNKARDSALDKAYKLKGKYAPEKKATVNINIDASPTDAKALELAQKFEDELKETLRE